MIDFAGHDIVVVGASMGGVEALSSLVRGLPADLPASVLVVQHVARGSVGTLGRILDGAGPLPAASAQDEEPIRPARIYVAPPDRHLLVAPGKLRVVFGPHENRWRPAIDPLFRSAAVAYGTRVIGVVLTGALDDGTAGMVAIKRCGGIAVVQHPEDAAYPDMPLNVMDQVRVDHIVALAEMGSLLERLVCQPASDSFSAPEDVVDEVRLMTNSVPRYARDAAGSIVLSCPECGGPLKPLHSDAVDRYRCETGHAFSAQSLLAEQSDAVERALWAAARALDDRIALLERLAREARERSRLQSAQGFEDRAAEARVHAGHLHRLLSANGE